MIHYDPLNNGLDASAVLQNINTDRNYSTFGELTNYIANFNSSTLYDVNYLYDKNGNITQKIETIQGNTATAL